MAALRQPVRVDQFPRMVIASADREAVLEISAAVLDGNRASHRVYLADLAEWLALPPRAFRNVQETWQPEAFQQVA